MKVKAGDVIESEFGRGPVVAITEYWLIHKDEVGCEYALSRIDDAIWIPATDFEVGGGQDTEIEVSGQ